MSWSASLPRRSLPTPPPGMPPTGTRWTCSVDWVRSDGSVSASMRHLAAQAVDRSSAACSSKSWPRPLPVSHWASMCTLCWQPACWGRSLRRSCEIGSCPSCSPESRRGHGPTRSLMPEQMSPGLALRHDATATATSSTVPRCTSPTAPSPTCCWWWCAPLWSPAACAGSRCWWSTAIVRV